MLLYLVTQLLLYLVTQMLLYLATQMLLYLLNKNVILSTKLMIHEILLKIDSTLITSSDKSKYRTDSL